MERLTLFADVLLPLPVSGTFTYRVPFELNDSIITGIRAVVQFGTRKIYTGLVVRVHETPPGNRIPKYILSLLDETPLVTPLQIQFWEWIASYYLCHLGEVMNAALPAAFKLASETRIILNPGFKEDSTELSEKESLMLDALHARKVIEISAISKIVGLQKVIPLIKTMIEKGMVSLEEELKDRYKPRKETFVRLTGEFAKDEENLKTLFNQLERRAKKQLEILMTYIQLSQFGFGEPLEVSRHNLLHKSKGTSAQLDNLVKKRVFELEEKVVGRLETGGSGISADLIELTRVQQSAIDDIRESFTARDVVLLHGVTSSGKTEIYIKLIEEVIQQGKQVLYLLPEIALTTQIINRLRKYFGNRVGVYHSRFNDHERVEIWNQTMKDQRDGTSPTERYDIILGARSAVFLPFSNLGLVIVDEEHDSSFKQADPAPRYNGRDVAIYLARIHHAHTLLGSATPALESYFNTQIGKYGLVSIAERFGNMELPGIQVVNLKEEMRQGTMKSHFSSVLMNQLASALEQGEQSILFQNRRGFSLRLECDTCHWMPSCRNCDVTLVYHKKSNQLRCHYCGFATRIPEKCPECQGISIRMKGFGTEKVEEELQILLPQARIARMDLDTTRSKHSHQKIITDFEDRKIDILVGTQMVTKGLDFDHVSTVCILNADNMLSYPDFRSAERSYQLMSQVSGRSGRKFKKGKVIIQTFNPGHMILTDVVNHDYLAMYKQQLAERRKFNYPPFSRLILLKLKHKDPEQLNKAASELAILLRKAFGKRVLGPEYPMVTRIMNYYIKHILLKIEKEASLVTFKTNLSAEIEKFIQRKTFGAGRVVVDVDVY